MSDELKQISFKVNNIGPHNNLKFNDEIKNFKIGCYAKNGVGKTFLSRMFRLLEDQNSKKSSELLSYGERKGYFEFTFENNNYSLRLTKDDLPNLKKESDLKFHVFNSDFISDNIEHEDYSLNNEISGYIVGKKSIDLKKEKNELKNLKLNKSKLARALNKKIDEYKSEFKKQYKINSNLTEFKEFSFENIITSQEEFNNEDINKEKVSLDEKFYKLKSKPDNLEDIQFKQFSYDINWESIIEICINEFSKSELPSNIHNFCKNNIEFIQLGMELYEKSDEECPFCKNKLNNNDTISNYYSFINDEESEIISKIEKQISKLNEFKEKYSKFSDDFENIIYKFNNIKSFFPDFNKELINFNKENMVKYVDELIKVLERKSKDVSLNLYTEAEEIISNIKKILEKVSNNNNSQTIEEINKIKNESAEYIKKLKREICKNKFKKFQCDKKEDLKKYHELDIEINNLSDSISKKEKEIKISKKEKVSKSFEYFLKKFFDKKYTFDSDKFTLVFKEKADLNMSNILSEGEKSIIAFCYYLAYTHTLIDNEEDYQKLVFIIDDPISSMDFNHVYTVGNIIRHIKDHFEIRTKIKYLIFTHNIDFINLLNKNNIIKERWIIENGEIKKFNYEFLLLPYQSHLSDVINVYLKEKEPSHTTPNSIRQILEKICYFENPNCDLNNFIEKDDILNQDSNLYLLINDWSHGGSSNNPIPKNEIIGCCETVIEYIKKYFPGQLRKYDL